MTIPTAVVVWNKFDGPRRVINPRCPMSVMPDDSQPDESFKALLDRSKPCGKPVTTLVDYSPHWMDYWCDEHAAMFEERGILHPMPT